MIVCHSISLLFFFKFNFINSLSQIILALCAMAGKLESLKFLLRIQKADPKALMDSFDPLCLSIPDGHLSIMKYLFEVEKFPINRRYDMGRTLLWLACLYGKLEIVKWLISVGASIKETNDSGWNIAFASATGGHLEVLKYVVTLGVDPKSPGSSGETPISEAARQGKLDCVQFMISVGCDPSATDNIDSNSLHCAASKGQLEVLKFLLTAKEKGGAGMDLKARDKRGANAFFYACKSGDVASAKYLVSLGIDTKTTGTDKTDIVLTTHPQSMEMFKYLIDDLNFNLDYRRADGFTPLVLACATENVQLAKFLLDRGANPKAKGQGLSCHDIAHGMENYKLG